MHTASLKRRIESLALGQGGAGVRISAFTCGDETGIALFKDANFNRPAREDAQNSKLGRSWAGDRDGLVA